MMKLLRVHSVVGIVAVVSSCSGGGSGSNIPNTLFNDRPSTGPNVVSDDGMVVADDESSAIDEESPIGTATYQDARVSFEYPFYWIPQIESDGSGVRFETPNTNFCGLDITDVSTVPNVDLEYMVVNFGLPLTGPNSSVEYLEVNGSRAARINGSITTPEGTVPWKLQMVYKFLTNFVMSCHGDAENAEAEFEIVFETFRVDA